MAQTTTALKSEVAELKAQLAEAQQQLANKTEGSDAELRMTVLLPESEDSLVYGGKAVKTREHDGVTYVDCKCVFMAGSSYGRHYQVSFSDHQAYAVLDRIKAGKRLTKITANFRTFLWRKNEFENVTIDSWTALTVADVPGVNYPELAPEEVIAPVKEAEPVSAEVDESIPF